MRRARVLATVALVALAVTLLAHPTLAQKAAALGKDPRNKSYYDDGFCYGHHYPKISPTWVNPNVTASAPAEVLVGVPFTVNLTLHNNWLYVTLPSTAMLNLSGAPNLRFVSTEATEATDATGRVLRADLRNPQGGKSTGVLTMPAESSTVTVTLAALSPTAGTPAGPDLDLALRTPDGRWFYANATGTGPEVLEVPQDAAVFHGGREWLTVVTYKSGLEPFADYAITAAGTRDPDALKHSARVSAEMREEGERFVYSWTLVADAPGPALLDFQARVFNYHKHTPADEGHTTDWGNLTRFDTTSVMVLGAPRPVEDASKRFLPTPALLALAAVALAAFAVARRL